MSDDKPTHTAEGLRLRANYIQDYHPETASALRAGADAMDAAKAWEAQSGRNCREFAFANYARLTAEARVAALEAHIRTIDSLSGCVYTDGGEELKDIGKFGDDYLKLLDAIDTAAADVELNRAALEKP